LVTPEAELDFSELSLVVEAGSVGAMFPSTSSGNGSLLIEAELDFGELSLVVEAGSVGAMFPSTGSGNG
jgi:hypothetical protein